MWSWINLFIVIFIGIGEKYFSSGAKKTIIDLGGKVATAVITGVSAWATKALVDNYISEDNDKDTDKNKDDNNKKDSKDIENSENKQDSSNKSK
jgi:hypothetical protein